MATYDAYPRYSSKEEQQLLLDIYESARQEQGKTDPATHPTLGEFVLKMVSGCQFNCKKQGDAGYDCYMYLTDDWRELPPVMTEEVASQTGHAIGAYAAEHDLEHVVALIHGGEPLFVPKDPARPQEKPSDYYERILPVIKAAVHEEAPHTDLRFGMQTNGALLNERNLDMLLAHGVVTGVSLDGPEDVHNVSRVILHESRRIGTYASVRRGLLKLMQEKYASIYGGIICTINVDSDPEAVLAELARYDPPTVELHLPYANWDDMPPRVADDPLRARDVVETLGFYRGNRHTLSPKEVETSLANNPDPERENRSLARALFEKTQASQSRDPDPVIPYAAWLRKFYQANLRLDRPLSVRLFKSIEQLSLGGNSLTEAIGPLAGGEVVINTDGSIELPDALRMSRSGLEKTDFSVFSHSLEEVARHLKIHRHLGKKSIADVCSNCDIQQICGGGHIATRWSNEHGFNNPSAYCPDLEDFVRFVRGATLKTHLHAVRHILGKRAQYATTLRQAAPFLTSSDWEAI